MMKVVLIEHTPDPEKIIAAAAKLCYSRVGVTEIMDNLNEEKTADFLNMLAEIGHDSPMEHITFTFGIEGVSRSLLAQFTRHRIASYSVKSQRYVAEGDFEFIVPPEIQSCPEALKIFNEAMENSRAAYDRIAGILKEKHMGDAVSTRLAEKKAIEDARYVLPNSCETKIVATFNARSLMNFFRLRLCERAQWEIRNMAEEMLVEVKRAAPTLFKNVGPPCVSAPCPEGKMSCGKIEQKRLFYSRPSKTH